MATKNLVPRIAGEGKLGISTKKWEEINALTGSFSNISASGFISASSFAGDGSGITDVTAEWDGTHDGNGNITGVLTVQAVSASGNISSSGNLYLDGFISASGNISTSGNFYSSGNLEITHITASGNISGSATSTGSFGRLEVVGNFVPTMGVGFTETPAEPSLTTVTGSIGLTTFRTDLATSGVDNTTDHWVLPDGVEGQLKKIHYITKAGSESQKIKPTNFHDMEEIELNTATDFIVLIFVGGKWDILFNNNCLIT